jgi:hypothetical protein
MSTAFPGGLIPGIQRIRLARTDSLPPKRMRNFRNLLKDGKCSNQRSERNATAPLDVLVGCIQTNDEPPLAHDGGNSVHSFSPACFGTRLVSTDGGMDGPYQKTAGAEVTETACP